ncbi:MAG TPA: winged helix DNA-binding domain-containing protein [Firmicutes bacterium]|nr:winged helix DNA-binding domain-containing protein [Candidatus Fermentithermobacillaceae bacterium]
MARKHHARKLPALKLRQALAFRMKRQHLLGKADDVVSSVRSSCGIQSQIPQQARIALWVRTRDLAPDDVDESLWRTRSLVKTWCMRATVHILPSASFYAYIQAVGPEVIRSEMRWVSRYGLSGHVVDKAVSAIFEALAGGPLTRNELGEKVARLAGDDLRQWVERRWGGLVKVAALRGLVCFGPDRGREVTFVRVKDWLPDANEPQTNTLSSQAFLLRSYLASYGPARISDFSYWSGISTTGARQALELLRDEIAQVTVDGEESLLLREDLCEAEEADFDEPVVNLLPSFDPYMLGHRQKSHLVDEANYKAIYRKAGWVSPVLLLNGRAAGVWEAERKGSRLAVSVKTFGPIRHEVLAAVEMQAESLAQFFGCKSVLTVKSDLGY